MTETAGDIARRSFSRRILAGSAAAALGPAVLNATPAAAATAAARAAGAVRRAGPGGQVRHMKLYAEKLSGDRTGFGLEKGKATVPGPLIELTEGDTLHIEFENTLDVPVSLHPHGVDYDRANDGTKMNDSVVEAGGTRTYTWRTHAPDKRADGTYRPGSAGYWHYHDHVVGTEHGTGGIRAGLYGALVVRREGDILPDKQFAVVFNDMKINNLAKGPDLKVTLGDRVEIVMITHGDYFHTFHVHGHRWADNRTGLLTGPDDPTRVIDTRTTGPADSFGFQIIAGEEAGAGAWMYHCHVQSHADAGMGGMLLVAKPDGTVPGHHQSH